MTADLPRTSREVRIAAAPTGLPRPENFALVETPLPDHVEPGTVLVRNRYFVVFPGLRTLMGDQVDGVPLPPLHVGDPLFGPAIGQVVDAPDGSSLRQGDMVMHMLGWRDYAVVPAENCTLLGDALPDPVAYLAQASAAYGAFTRLAVIREGDVVFITGAAGAVGTLAGQIARLLGAGRVIGSTGSPDKAERLKKELGYDAVVLRGADAEAGSIAEQLADAAPDGIDVVLDNVGGEQLIAAIATARQGARFALNGALSGQLDANRSDSVAPAEIDTFRLVVKGISLRGYAGADHPDVEPEWIERFGEWLRSGAIHFPHTVIRGLDRAPHALPDLIGGRFFGTAIVEV
jgi:NADPH-dependent curcumin reductase CurA